MTTAAAKPAISPGESSQTRPRLFALVPCAGSGHRAGTTRPKQYEMLLGQAMVFHTIAAFRALGDALTGLWVVTAPGDRQFMDACPDFGTGSEVLEECGGATRAATVLNGLAAMLEGKHKARAGPMDWVLVHDAARCLITPSQIMALVDACRNDKVGGLLAQKLPDTLKAGLDGRVVATIGRSDKWLAQTPQMFRIGELAAALRAGGVNMTDESSAMEAQGLAPRLVPGSAQNFKVTYPEDFALAEAILEGRAGARSQRSMQP